MVVQTETSCGLCGGDQFEYLADETRLWSVRDGQRMVRCTHCGLVQILPHTARAVDYGQDYFTSHAVCEEGTVDYAARIGLFRQRLREINSYVDPGKLLDVGCAKGDFLRLARDEFGWDVTGLDISEWAAEYARSVHNIEVQKASVTDASFDEEAFDVVHLNHVLEHLTAPLAALKRIRGWLKPGGYLYLEVPNEMDNLPWRIDVFLRRTYSGGSVFGQRKPRAKATPHLYFFTPTTLARLVEKAGFEIVRVRTRTDTSRWFRSLSRKNLKVALYHLTRAIGQWIGKGSNIVVIARKPVSRV